MRRLLALIVGLWAFFAAFAVLLESIGIYIAKTADTAPALVVR